jgi:enoyl-CoA hydratase/carnithine racemase
MTYTTCEVLDGVGILTLDHPAKRNALGWELHREILGALAEWGHDPAVACVLIQGNEEYFCSGWDLTVLDGIGPDDRREFTDLACELMTRLYDFRKPTVCAVAGFAPGYAMDVANMCDVTVASTTASFASSQVRLGMNGFYGGLMRKIGPMRARKLFFTGEPFDAEEAFRLGMVDEVVPAGELLARAGAVARQIAEAGSELTVVLKEVALRAQNMDHVSGIAYELRVTHDLTQRGVFRQRTGEGNRRLQADEPTVAAERHSA